MQNTKKIFAYIQKRVCANEGSCASIVLFNTIDLFLRINHFLKISAQDPQTTLRVSENSNSILNPQKSKLDSQFSKTLRIENRVSSQDCQLTFQWYCKPYAEYLFLSLMMP